MQKGRCKAPFVLKQVRKSASRKSCCQAPPPDSLFLPCLVFSEAETGHILYFHASLCAVPDCPKTPKSCHSRESGNLQVLIITELTIFIIPYMSRFFLFLDWLVRRMRICFIKSTGRLNTNRESRIKTLLIMRLFLVLIILREIT